MIVYGQEGPEYTGIGRLTLQEAIDDAVKESKDTGYKIDIKGLCICPNCYKTAIETEICDCGYQSPTYLAKKQAFEDLLAKIKEQGLHNCPQDQEIFGQ
jgi:hypothetical protein